MGSLSMFFLGAIYDMLLPIKNMSRAKITQRTNGWQETQPNTSEHNPHPNYLGVTLRISHSSLQT